MSCNPAVGGLAKSHLVYELDALGGEMGKAADLSGIQFRTLNRKKGPAVQATRIQCEIEGYSGLVEKALRATGGLRLVTGRVEGIRAHGGAVAGVVLDTGQVLKAKAVVLTPGTFLKGRIYVGKECQQGGRIDEQSADGLCAELERLGFELGRLKTGTPPRLDRRTLDFSVMEEQPGEYPPPLFSWAGMKAYRMFHVEHQQTDRPVPGLNQMPCHITRTTAKTHEIVRRNLDQSALYGGLITGTGARYCPSLEDKIVRFPAKDSHHVFIEPQGRDSPLVYPNGISNSLPADVQLEIVHSIPGLEKAELCVMGYGIEYEFCHPTQLTCTLESKVVENLYLAGQINGTTGYEEAAAQGFMAGINAARKVTGRSRVVIGRSEGYIGVLVDDLVTKGVDEPYRMFTSRAERRLLLRQGNARYRMLALADEIGVADRDSLTETAQYRSQIDAELDRLAKNRRHGRPFIDELRRPGCRYDDCDWADMGLPQPVRQEVEVRVKYEGYLDREARLAQAYEELEKRIIPDCIDYGKVPGLKTEAREKLARVQPENLGRASRIPGVSPADISVLSVAIGGSRRRS
jgi:tRNA uridine 5-carboxymethylaminomethyl modification enzyme